ncbi:glycosyltransferase family 4 protein [Massilia antarctica]|uniref:glycosyltransferase family 4 protein n=1 Tax=Massilia antarctica TaxID=2765360 RepID=UPI0022716EA7|nr:glycosyltransferase family 4 protein [Massilia sp. H27-R4]MCY0913209.1 glycosyltransferase family 4 protein [Massilia sp. H27-R4]
MSAETITLTGLPPRRAQRILFIHQNFPGQFGRIAASLARDPRYDVLAVGKDGCPGLPGVRTVACQLHREPAPATHHYAKPFEAGILYGQACLRLLITVKEKGFVPDVIIAHPGWGETLFVKEVFPHARLIHFSEFYYHTDDADVGFDPEFPSTIDDRARVRAKNALQLLNLEACDLAVAPTQWQKSLHPRAYHDKIHLIHEGIDTDFMRPNPDAVFTLPNGKVLRPGDPVLTYVSRNLEPYRGFHIFMRALPQILADNPGCDIVLAGGADVSYGARTADGRSWRDTMLAEVKVDPERVHFLDHISYARYRDLLQVSAAHVYLTYPFVLSWSMLEAMACGCLVIGSDTAPVTEVLRDGDNGLLVDFFDTAAIADKVCQAMRDPVKFYPMRERTVSSIREKYAFEQGIVGYRQLIRTVSVRGRTDAT